MEDFDEALRLKGVMRCVYLGNNQIYIRDQNERFIRMGYLGFDQIQIIVFSFYEGGENGKNLEQGRNDI